MIYGAASPAGWSDAAYGDQSPEGRSRLGYVISLITCTLSDPCLIPGWTLTFTRTLVGNSLGAEVYASSEVIDHVALLRENYAPFLNMSPGMIGLGSCESPPTHLRHTETITGKCLARRGSALSKL